MNTLHVPARAPVWRSGIAHWVAVALGLGALVLAFADPLRFTVASWRQVEEYSYGWFIPVIAAFLVWQRSDRLRAMELRGHPGGLALIALALAMLVVGELSAIRSFGQYGFVVGVAGLAVCVAGWRGARALAMPIAVLLFMIPLPQFVLRELSHALQLVSSQLGVAMIRGFGISVYLEGNVIDLGSFKMQVVEACNGLRYLFPLMVLGVLSAYFFRAPMWQRVLLVVSTVPLTVVINSLRIALIGWTVEHWGREMAEGLLHDLEGFFMFLLCLALLIGEMALLARFAPGGRRTLAQAFALDMPAPPARGAAVTWRPLPRAGIAAAVLAAAGAAALAQMPERGRAMPPRESFASFPLVLPGGWTGQTERLDAEITSWLAVDDYFLANYRRSPDEPPVNFYSAFYVSQSSGQSSHSPRTCIPGGGWSITSLREVTLAMSAADGSARSQPLVVNRALIQNGEQRQLVYYWFRQRGRELTDEFAVKWHILADGITRDRTDGALLRLVTPIAPRESEASAEERLLAFLSRIDGGLGRYVPD